MGTFFITLFALIEIILFVWVFGIDRGWEEMHKGARLQVPRFFYWVMKYVTPIMLIGIIGGWLFTEWIPTIMKSGTTIWITRIFILIMLIIGGILVHRAFQREETA